ncbi:MAG: DUF4870 domain-containing protein [Ktedonobacteraceae bacterium]
MAQDPNQQSTYSSGYGGYTQPPRPSDPYTGPQDEYQQQQQGSYQGQQQQQFSYGQQQQQYSTYQPPSSAARDATANDPTSTGLSARTEALLSYLLWWFGGLIFFVIERKNRFVRFHAAQSFIFFGSVSLVLALLHFISIIPILGFLLGLPLAFASTVITVLAIIVWLFMIFQAYRGVYFRLPFVSGYADSLVDRFTSKK